MRITHYDPEPLADPIKNLIKKNGRTRASPKQQHDATIMITRTAKILNKDILSHYTKLTDILIARAGADNIDTGRCDTQGITIHTASGGNAHTVAEYMIGQIIMCLRQTYPQTASMRAGDRHKIEGIPLAKSTIGLLGCGHIGQTIAKTLNLLGCQTILGYDRLEGPRLASYHIQKTSLPDLASRADVVCVQLPLTDQTYNCVSHDFFAMMKRSARLINVGRGEVVDTAALFAALDEKTIAGAVCDVFPNEPSIDPGFLTRPNLIPTPHIAAFTPDTIESMYRTVIDRYLGSCSS